MYKILTNNYRVDLELEIDKYLVDGYQLVGGVSVTNNESAGCYLYAQAIIKYEFDFPMVEVLREDGELYLS